MRVPGQTAGRAPLNESPSTASGFARCASGCAIRARLSAVALVQCPHQAREVGLVKPRSPRDDQREALTGDV